MRALTDNAPPCLRRFPSEPGVAPNPSLGSHSAPDSFYELVVR